MSFGSAACNAKGLEAIISALEVILPPELLQRLNAIVERPVLVKLRSASKRITKEYVAKRAARVRKYEPGVRPELRAVDVVFAWDKPSEARTSDFRSREG